MPNYRRLMGDVSAIVALVATATAAFGGSYFEKDGAAIRGYDPVAYFTQSKPVKGSPAYQVAHKGSTTASCTSITTPTYRRSGAPIFQDTS